ncbi:MAG: NAD-dependent epimerase/dehydratase family protein, partial [Alphaproteobacteria bacterium]|nr:NAD-dependent epimerase/dehydratase family protein [Alphaproteobacteria bacterium]
MQVEDAGAALRAVDARDGPARRGVGQQAEEAATARGQGAPRQGQRRQHELDEAGGLARAEGRARRAGLDPWAQLRVGDMADAADLAAAARSCDGIFHLAAIASVPRCLAEPERARAVNLGGARNAIAAARRPGAAPGVVREESETRPISGYGAEKLAGERLAAQAAGVGAARAPRFDAFNVCTGRATTLQGLLEAMARRAGRTPRVLRAPPRPGD